MIEIEFIGAAGTVTGSRHLLRTSKATVLLDCGLFQGHREESNRRNRKLGVPVDELDAVLLSHAHIDHSGALPALCRSGYLGSIYCTPATRDLCAPMLLDSAMIQEHDARHVRKLIRRGVKSLKPFEPLYSRDDATSAFRQMVSIPYHNRQNVAPGVDVTFLDAGHVLGSAVVVIDVKDGNRQLRLAFTGDLGRRHLPILRDPEIAEGVDCLLMESTYGDRLHEPIEQTGTKLAEVVNRTIERKGKVVIPSFALERSQEIIYELNLLRGRGAIPKVPVYVDSPLAVRLTDVFKMHPDCYDRAAHELLHAGDPPFEFDGLRYVTKVEESKAIEKEDRPSIVISASGMCEGGRVLHHLKATVSDKRNTVLIVGFQAEHTLGRRIVERQDEVRIFGKMYPLRAEVVVMNGFSAHADQKGLVKYARSIQQNGTLRQVILVHGEPDAQHELAAKLQEEGLPKVDIPTTGDRVQL